MIKLYNTVSRKLEEFKPIEKGEVGIYSCGPTVYWNQHIGHMYAYVQWESLVRFLKWLGFKVKWVMNITDVGHLTSEADTGEDKMEKGAKREGLTVWQIADKYLAQFLDSLDTLNINRPDVLSRATDHIKEQIELIEKIEANGFTYKTKTGLVFDTSKFAGYSKFAKLNLNQQQAGARVEVDKEKKKPWDFLLWVTNQPDHIMQWDSPWGKGFPGWHIECTAMSTKYLGEKFDIHTGGKEHIPVHHTNEIAQGYGAFGGQTANYWLHNEWLTLKDTKMSKSLGNMILVTDLIKKGFDPLAFRYLVLTSHYRQGLVFSWQALKAAQTAYDRLVGMVREWQQNQGRKTIGEDDPQRIADLRQLFTGKLAADFNTPEALAVVWQLVKSDLPNRDKLDLLLDFDQVLGLDLAGQAKTVTEPVPQKVKELARKRDQLREKEAWVEADQVRQEMTELGWEVEDTPKGPLIKKARRFYNNN